MVEHLLYRVDEVMEMKTKRKICVVTANRTDFSRLETALEEIQKHEGLELQLIVIGAHLLDKAGYTVREIERKGFPISHRIFMEIAGSTPTTMAKSVGVAMIELSSVFEHLKPDIVLTHGDRYEALAVGSTAAIMNICVGHIQGGEVSGSIDESIRHALTKMSHLHFASTDESKERIIKMGEDPDAVFNVGCPGTDILLRAPVMSKEETLRELNKFTRVKSFSKSEDFILVLQHPVTTEFKSAGDQILETIDALMERPEQLIVIWPNIDAGAEDLSAALRRHPIFSREGTKFLKHLPSELFVNVIRNAACVVGNSSSGIREACYFGTPVVNVGSRQEGRERGGNVVDAPYNKEEIQRAIEAQVRHGRFEAEKIYGDGTAGRQLSHICATCELPSVQKKIQY